MYIYAFCNVRVKIFKIFNQYCIHVLSSLNITGRPNFKVEMVDLFTVRFLKIFLSCLAVIIHILFNRSDDKLVIG